MEDASRSQVKEKQHHDLRESCHKYACPFLLVNEPGSEPVLPGMGSEGLDIGMNWRSKSQENLEEEV